ncbi:hypothetical protein C8A00DRAFT_42145 [Chaetomidium leptoderma]|uniref:ATP-dependent RNA helicase n=1 Tax=Chaetomidium leptoderma TaxID=669021 RepID=A0AAN6VP23_9PEZI|nr:hypothetical protein C8A00DRAFT_42145 [Chaetomidium leptoderma]
MAPSQKRKTLPSNDNDDFIFTISDNEPDIVEEEIAAPPSKKVKTGSNATKLGKKDKKDKKTKKNKKNKKDDEDDDVEAEKEEEEATGLWGTNDADDGAMDSDFEFGFDGANAFDAGEFEGWGFESAKKGMAPGAADRSGVDLDEIIRRRREKKGGKGVVEEVEKEEVEEEVGDVDLDDEVLAEDGFGMGVGSDVEEDEVMGDGEGGEDSEEEAGEEEEEGEEGDEAASDDDSVASPVQHPDDADDSEGDEEEDAEEEAKRKEFFAAPEETEKAGKKGDLSSFQNMSLSRPILRGLTSVGFTKPTPIQAKTIPIALMGKDVVGGAVTGSGKTAAFVVPILERLLYRPKKVPTTRVVIMTPTRELAIQCHSVAVKLASHTDIKFCLAVGGLSLKVQEAELRLRPDVVIATPGRFIDHMRNSASFAVDTVEIMVLDEADRMLEDGFADELNEIFTALPKSRQTMLFSATMTSSVDNLIRVGLNKPARIMVDTQKKTVVTLTQEFVRLRPGREDKRMGYLGHHFLPAEEDCPQYSYYLWSVGAIVGRTTRKHEPGSAFRDGKVNYLLATDLASRGLDIKGVDTVINYEAPQSLEIYVHRVGRTARAGRSGVAITLAAEPDRKVVKSAVRAGKAQGAKIISRVIDVADADKWQDEVDEMDDEIDEILREEKEEKQLAQFEMQVKKGENMIKHEEEINSRPRRTWFETQQDKKAAKELGRSELNGVRDAMKKKGAGRLSNKDKKKLDSKAERSDSRSWKKGREERDGKGAVLNLKKPPRPRPHHRSALLRYLFPPAVRERLFRFRYDTLPRYKHGLQSRIYRFILERQRRRREKKQKKKKKGSRGPMTRRNRMLIGLARRLSAIPPPVITQSESGASSHEQYEEMKEEQRIAREAQEIEKRGQDEKEVANRGGYSESPGGVKGGSPAPVSPPSSPTLSARTPTMSQSDMTDAELAVANANLMARLGPFMTTPLVQIPITIFFYNDEQSRSQTVLTDDSGHFNARVALEFVPTDVRVIANENISTTKPVEIIESKGISLISDVDDTVKRSNISLGAREIFRNTFVRDLADLTVDGVKEWYHAMHEMGVKVHYCSNSPWQLFPVLATFFHTAGLPQGSIHLKHYSGMLQGIFEPVAERKKGTLETIIRDFPGRKFLLVGDSGEADLEVYTELVVANPGRILAVFIRDVTSPDQTGFFDSSFSADPGQRNRPGSTRAGPGSQPVREAERRPQLPPRATAPPPNSGPVMGTLIDFDEPEPVSFPDLRKTSTASLDGLARKPPPPRPAKPAALRSFPSDTSSNSLRGSPGGLDTSQPLAHRPRTSAGTPSPSPKPTPPPPPPPRRRGTSPMVQQVQQQQQQQPPRNSANTNSDVPDMDVFPTVSGAYPASFADTATPPNGAAANVSINKKVDLWLRRLARAHEILDAQGVQLYTWRRGDDVIAEAEGIVREALREMEKEDKGGGLRG